MTPFPKLCFDNLAASINQAEQSLEKLKFAMSTMEIHNYLASLTDEQRFILYHHPYPPPHEEAPWLQYAPFSLTHFEKGVLCWSNYARECMAYLSNFQK